MENTERPSTIDVGTKYLVGTKSEKILETARPILSGQNKEGSIPPLWDGKAAKRIAKIILKNFANS